MLKFHQKIRKTSFPRYLASTLEIDVVTMYLRETGLQSRFPDFLRKTSTTIPSANRPNKTPIMITSKITVSSECPDKRPSISSDGLKAYKK